jgi:hypothetical protein
MEGVPLSQDGLGLDRRQAEGVRGEHIALEIDNLIDDHGLGSWRYRRV